jgi:hypothetical protein
MLDGFFAILVMPIYLCGAFILFILNTLFKIFNFKEYILSIENFTQFFDYYKYPIGFIEIVFLFILFYDGK